MPSGMPSGKRKAKQVLYHRPVRMKDLVDAHNDVLVIHAEFADIRQSNPTQLDDEIISLEAELYVTAAGAAEACKFDEVSNDRPLFGPYRTAYINCRTYLDRIGSANKLFKLVI